MNTLELYKLYPCKMLARDFNEENNNYKKLPFVSSAGSLSDNCYIRYTKSGYVLYNKNGYLHPICVVYSGKTKYLISQIKPYIDTIIEYLNNNELN